MPEKKGVLYLIPTVLAPATSGKVLSPQIKDVITHINHFFVENVRTARRFISELQTGKPIESLQFYTLDKDTPSAEVAQYMNILLNGEDAGVMSEAGCPGIADPGAMAVHLAHKKEIQVVPLVGPSSILLALMASGFSGQSFVFHGYLPIDRTERSKAIRQLEKDSVLKKQTQICIETPFRNNQLLDDFLQTCHPETLLCIATHITAPDEMIRTSTIIQWAKHKPDLHKKPTIFLLYSTS